MSANHRFFLKWKPPKRKPQVSKPRPKAITKRELKEYVETANNVTEHGVAPQNHKPVTKEEILFALLTTGIMVLSGYTVSTVGHNNYHKDPHKEKAREYKVLAVPVTTSDVPQVNESVLEEITDRLFSPDNPSSIYNWFKLTSNGKFKFLGTVTKPFVLSKDAANYTGTFVGGAPGPNQKEFVNDAIKTIDDTVDFSEFDGNNDGSVDHVLFLTPPHLAQNFSGDKSWNTHYFHKTFAFSNFTKADNVWINQWTVFDMPDKTDVKKDYDFSDWSSGVAVGFKDVWYGFLLHEILHSINFTVHEYISHLADSRGGTGPFDSMSGGHHKIFNNISEPAYLSVYNRIQMGFVKPHVLNFGTNETIRIWQADSPESKDKIEAVKVNLTKDGKDYLLLEWRNGQPAQKWHNFDIGLPTGLAVYNVTDYVELSVNKTSQIISWYGMMPRVVDATPGDSSTYPAGTWKNALLNPDTVMSVLARPGRHIEYYENGTPYLVIPPENVRVEIVKIDSKERWTDVKITYLVPK